jgi:hypothetical protein
MSLRAKVDRARIELFLSKLSERFHRPAQILLVGGTTLVFEELRDQTLDIDLVIQVDPNHHGELIQAIRKLKDQLSINVEEASPADFIPLPSGFENRHKFVERYGKIDVMHFDLYSTALSKIERGREQDFEDVLSLLQAGKLEWDRLSAYFLEILPKMGEHSLKQNPAEFEQNFHALESKWRAASGSS